MKQTPVIQTGKTRRQSYILSCLPFPYPAIFQHSIVQILFLIAGLEFTLRDHHINFARAFHELVYYRVISAARFENTWPEHSANFENGMDFVQSVW